jgi:DNA-binding beta-propeller fold protein YncE
MKNCKLLFLFLFLHCCEAGISQNRQYDLDKTIPVGDGLGWDYTAVDEVNQNIYFSHAARVLVCSAKKDSVIAEIPNTTGVHGIAFDHALNKGFISNGKANSVTVFDLLTFKTLDTVAVTGTNPDAILFDPYSKKIIAFNGKSANATVIDPSTVKVVTTISLPGKPEFAVTDAKGNIYVNIEDKSEIVQLDANDFTVKRSWSVAPGEEPSGLAFDRKNNILFSVCANKKMIVFDIATEKILSVVEIGGGVDAVVFDPETKLIYSSNGEGNVTIVKQISPASYQTIQVLQTQKGCKTMAMNEKTKKIYLAAAQFEGNTRKILPGSFNILVYKPR